jgi:hypothetical protein
MADPAASRRSDELAAEMAALTTNLTVATRQRKAGHVVIEARRALSERRASGEHHRTEDQQQPESGSRTARAIPLEESSGLHQGDP